jgi:hypothetical protein
MKLRITSITTSEVGKPICEVTINLEDRLRPVVEQRDYGGGVQQFVVFFVSVDSDPLENERFCVANNRVGRYKDILTGKMVRFLGLAVPVDPSRVVKSTQESLGRLLQSLMLEELKDPAYALPKKFDRERLLTDFTAALVNG